MVRRHASRSPLHREERMPKNARKPRLEPGKRLHAESLLRIPLVRQMMEDPEIRLVPRALDASWKYHQVAPISVVGFNPWIKSIFYASGSLFAAWLEDPCGSARAHNEGDLLVYEVLLAAHDYLHAWASLAIAALRPELRFGIGRLTSKNLEDHVFCHLLTEAVASGGLDYWYLATVDLNDVCDIGTRTRGLTSAYDERHLPEYRRYNPTLDVQRVEFLGELTRFYCTGALRGFDLRAVRRSPIVHRWLVRELSYGTRQRVYTRQWFAHLAAEEIRYSPQQLEAPVDCAAPWKQELVRDVSRLLWEKTKDDVLHPFGAGWDPRQTWTAPVTKPVDYRFTNYNALPAGLRSAPQHGPVDVFEYYFYQRVGRHRFATFDEELVKLFPSLIERRDVALIESVLRHQELLPEGRGEPRDLFMPN